MQEYFEYEDLHKHQGTENYEVVIIYNENSIIKEKLIEEKQHFLSVIGRDEKQKISERKKVDFFGNTINKFIIYNTLSDGTLWGSEHYVNWLINGDTTKHDYIDPLTLEDKNEPEKWLKEFIEYYNKASYVYESSWSYYMKIEEKWYKFKYDKSLFIPELFNKHVYKQYPAKDPKDIRMLPLIESMEDLMKSKTIKVVDYIQQDSEKGIGLNPINFSSGYYMLEFYLPQGDTLKFRRYGAMGVSSEMFVYQIPKALGGSDEVFFIEQEPNSMYPNKSFAGFYAIRPKNYKQLPEYKLQLEKEHQQAVEKRRKF
ncbi:hypothetical protein JJL45_02390 [Tamlana sp. s12]|uniref:hypothetical protein n=1 Tax=Tamlana sp. s12 TaxID=1630406 RepID=UPI000A5E9A36|nr:hypothetical protein [Tamlana sp. s12]QQY82860.1 hypothetical protein JJL45_02390 [Tamlana sp. s12]